MLFPCGRLQWYKGSYCGSPFLRTILCFSFFQGTTYVPKTPQDEEEDKILEAYLTGMRIEGDQLRLPPASELQDGFDLFYKRRSLRKTYQYEMSDGEQFSLTVCKDQATNVCPYEPDASSIDDISPKVFHQCFYNCLAQKLLYALMSFFYYAMSGAPICSLALFNSFKMRST